MPGRKPAIARLDQARTAHAEADRKIGKLEAARTAALLADKDDEAARLDGELEQLRRLSRGFHDKVQLLAMEAEREAQQYRDRERLAQVERNEAALRKRDALAAELTAGLMQADKAMRAICKIGRGLRASWSWSGPDAQACLLHDGAIVQAITHEIFRIGRRPRAYGGLDRPDGDFTDFPGGASPRLELRDLPEKAMPLADVLREASAFAGKLMREGKGAALPVITEPTPPATNGDDRGHYLPLASNDHSAAAPAEPLPDSAAPQPKGAAEERLTALLARQNELAAKSEMSPHDDAEYASTVQQIALVSAEIEKGKANV